uniref:Ig-like domain-containing protein n=1 Tax=Leptobrachium leishanense TaxID=445787 RepID=A0A8C5PLH0_9ANUR
MVSIRCTKYSSDWKLLLLMWTNSLHRFNISQPQELLSQKGNTSTITCSFTPPQDRDLLNIRIYWRAGSPRGAYAYHPNKEMIDPHYKDRTELKGNLDLHIMNVQEEDETSYYCFVMLTLCTSPYNYKSVIDLGRGTKLTVTSKCTVLSYIAISALKCICHSASQYKTHS